MKLMLAVALMVVGSVAHAAADTTPGVEMLMLNKNPQPSIGDRIALHEVSGNKCRFYGKVAGVVGSQSLEIVINRKTCADGVTRGANLVVPLRPGSDYGSEAVIGYPA